VQGYTTDIVKIL